MFEDIAGYHDIRGINLKSFDYIRLFVFATLQHWTNTLSRLIIEIRLQACNLHREFALLCKLYYQRHGIETFSNYSSSSDVTVLFWELKKQKYNATKSILKLILKPEVYSSRKTLSVKNGLIKVYCVWPTVFK